MDCWDLICLKCLQVTTLSSRPPVPSCLRRHTRGHAHALTHTHAHMYVCTHTYMCMCVSLKGDHWVVEEMFVFKETCRAAYWAKALGSKGVRGQGVRTPASRTLSSADIQGIEPRTLWASLPLHYHPILDLMTSVHARTHTHTHTPSTIPYLILWRMHTNMHARTHQHTHLHAYISTHLQKKQMRKHLHTNLDMNKILEINRSQNIE